MEEFQSQVDDILQNISDVLSAERETLDLLEMQASQREEYIRNLSAKSAGLDSERMQYADKIGEYFQKSNVRLMEFVSHYQNHVRLTNESLQRIIRREGSSGYPEERVNTAILIRKSHRQMNELIILGKDEYAKLLQTADTPINKSIVKVYICPDEREVGDIEECGLTENDLTYINLAKKLLECDEIPEGEENTKCYYDAIVPFYNISLCEIIGDTEWRNGNIWKGYCYADIAKHYNNESICAKGKDWVRVEYCYEMVARKKQDITVCENIKEDRRSMCYMYIGLDKRDKDICNMIPRDDIRESCLDKIGGNKPDAGATDDSKSDSQVLGLEPQHILGVNMPPEEGLRVLEIIAVPRKNSEPLHLPPVTIQVTASDEDIYLNHSFQSIKQGTAYREGYLSQGDIIMITINLKEAVKENQKLKIKIIPETGTTTIAEPATPQQIITQRTNIWP
ncbi:MAG: hypothetical protein GF416_04375 [Candidatus Altiarchaeales archaeon]|nr:hypothetical protein [Candidatus Altiarchaeales archaeon]MBD3416356.1 hypothetical protein [Candidatus Altiarchaeales archaeon]